LAAKNIVGRLFNGPVAAKIATIERGAPPSFRINLKGNADIANLDGVMSPQLNSRFSGSTDWLAEVSVSEQGVEVDVSSGLEGIDINLPEPLAKASFETIPLKIKFKDGKVIPKSLVLTTGDDLYVSLESNEIRNGQLLDKGVIFIGQNKANIELQEGIRIFANTIFSDVDAWLNSISEMSKVENGNKPGVRFVDRLRGIFIESKDLHFLNKSLGETNTDLISQNGRDWQIIFNSENAKGQGAIQPFSDIKEYSIDFDKLYWPISEVSLKEGK